MKKIIVFVTVFALALGLVACAAQKAEWQSHLDLGQKYLLDGNYEQAIVEFNRVIEIDPKNVEAYIGLADAYAALGDYESAIEALERGIAETDSDELRAKLDEIRALAEAAASAGEEGQGETETGTGRDEDRGEPETTGQDEQTEQEESLIPKMPKPEEQIFSTRSQNDFNQIIPLADENGKYTFSYLIDGDWRGARQNYTDESGRPVSFTSISFDYVQSGTREEPKSYTLNVTKNEISLENRKVDNTDVDTSWTYDPDREVWIGNSTSSSGHVNSTTTEYNKKGELSKYISNVGDEESKAVCTNEFIYDDSGKISQQIYTEESSTYLTQTTLTYTYNSMDRISKILRAHTSDGFTQMFAYYYNYDSVGNMISIEERSIDSTNHMESAYFRRIYEYGSDCFPIKEVEYEPIRATVYPDGSEDVEWATITTVDYVY